MFIGNANAIGARRRGAGFDWSSYSGSFVMQSIQPSTIEQVVLTLKADTGSNLLLNFDDGLGDINIIADGHDHDYTSSYSSGSNTYNITISGVLYNIKKFKVINNTTLSINLDDFEHWGLNQLELDTITGNTTGSINKLPDTLASLILNQIGSLIIGSINNLPKGLTLLSLIAHPLVSGQLQNLSKYLIDLHMEDCPGIDGNINGFSDEARTIYLSDLSQTITGTLENLPKKRINTLVLENIGTGISGNIECLNNTEKIYYGNIRYLIISPTSSTNSFEGSFDTFMLNNPDSWLTLKLINLGENITGSLDYIPTLGDKGELYIVNSGDFTYNGGTLPSYGNNPTKIHCGLSESEIDDFLINYAATSIVAFCTLFDLSGNNAGHSSVSDTAIDTLVSEYRNVYLNDPAEVTNFDISLGTTFTTNAIKITIENNRKFLKSGIDWGDGSPVEYVFDYLSSNNIFTHTYPASGAKTIKIINAYGLKYLRTVASEFPSVTGSLNQFTNCNYIEYFEFNSSSGSMTGSLNSVQNSNLKKLSCSSLGNAVTLDLDDLGANATALTTLYVVFMASGNVINKLSSLPNTLTTLTLYSVGNVFDIATGPHPSWALNKITLVNNHSSENVDSFLISWSSTAGSGTKTIELTRQRTSASDAAVAILQSLGKIINTHN